MDITITNDQKEISLNRKKIRDLVKDIFEILGLPAQTGINIIFTDKVKIAGLNRLYFKKNRPTDVIALGYRKIPGIGEGAKKAKFSAGRKKRRPHDSYLGDLIICPAVARENAKIYNTKSFFELIFYIIHGVLHLLGYSDIRGIDKRKMYKRQQEALDILCQRHPGL